jgi:hypothetical protein
MGSDPPVLLLCNRASSPDESSSDQSAIVIDYRDREGVLANVKLGLPNFVRDVYHLSDRTLDLLELAAYVYCADRMSRRGAKGPGFPFGPLNWSILRRICNIRSRRGGFVVLGFYTDELAGLP